jgi:hypothetical protein
MISATQLSATSAASFQTSLLNMMNPLIQTGIVSRSKVVSTYQAAMSAIKSEAEIGARRGVIAEIPSIEAKVRKEATASARASVKPLIIGALAVSGIAAILGVVAIAQARKTRKGS